jgi:hypothetical protein
MHFMILIIANESKPLPPPAELAALGRAYGEFSQSLVASGQLRGGFRLEPSSRSRTLRLQGQRHVVTHGPAVPGDEHFAGYFIVECGGVEEALDIARRVPGLRLGEAVEVRPLAEPAS